MSPQVMSMKQAAQLMIQEAGEPLHYRDITERALKRGLIAPTGKTPAASMNALITVDIKQNGANSPFYRVGPGIFGLQDAAREARLHTQQSSKEDTERRVRTPFYPNYEELRLLLPIWSGVLRTNITGLRSTIVQLRGTPQNQVNWKNPEQWIPERLAGAEQKLASAIWEGSKHQVNPRYDYGHWLLSNTYKLLEEDASGVMNLSARGRDFIESVGGETEALLDEYEGLLKILAIVSESGPARLSEFIHEWGDYLQRRSKFKTENSIKVTLRRRLRNLKVRGLIEYSGNAYSITQQGLDYLARYGDADAPETDEQTQLRTLLKQQKESVRESLYELLIDMNPYAFEHLIKRLLEAMGYDNPEVTSPSNDGGVDVVADITLGITSVREVVQVKRHKRTIQRKDLDALRGSLFRFNAVRGTIVTTSRFSKGTEKAAVEIGAPPITLIDGERLIDLLIEFELGVKATSIKVLELDPNALAEIEDELNNE